MNPLKINDRPHRIVRRYRRLMPTSTSMSATVPTDSLRTTANPAMHQSWAVDFATSTAMTKSTVSGQSPTLTDAFIQKLFRIFLVFTDEMDDGVGMTYAQLIARKQRVTVDEVRALCALIMREIGIADVHDEGAATTTNSFMTENGHICDDGQLTNVRLMLRSHTNLKIAGVPWPTADCACCVMLARIDDHPAAYTFREFIWTLARLFPDRCVIEAAVDSVFQRICNQVIKHGFVYVYHKPSVCRSANECQLAWLTITPGRLTFWPLNGSPPISQVDIGATQTPIGEKTTKRKHSSKSPAPAKKKEYKLARDKSVVQVASAYDCKLHFRPASTSAPTSTPTAGGDICGRSSWNQSER